MQCFIQHHINLNFKMVSELLWLVHWFCSSYRFIQGPG